MEYELNNQKYNVIIIFLLCKFLCVIGIKSCIVENNLFNFWVEKNMLSNLSYFPDLLSIISECANLLI